MKLTANGKATPWMEVLAPTRTLVEAAGRAAEGASVTMAVMRSVKPQIVHFDHDNQTYRLRMTSYGTYVIEGSKLLDARIVELLDALILLSATEGHNGFSYAFITYRCVLTTGTAPAGSSERLRGSSLGDAQLKTLSEIEAAA